MSQERNSYPTFVEFSEVKGREGYVPFATIIGFVARDPKQNTTPSGKAVVNTSIPVNKMARTINNVLGTKFGEDETVFVELTGWERTAESVEKSGLAKGDMIAVTGTVALEEYEGKDRVRMNISRFQILRRKNPNTANTTASNDNAPMNGEPIDVNDDDLPF